MQNHMCAQVLSCGKGSRAFGHSPRGPTPLSVDILGSAAKHTRRGGPSLGMGHRLLGGKELHRLPAPTPQAHSFHGP